MMILMSVLALMVQPTDEAKLDPIQTEEAAAAISEPGCEQALEEAAAKPQPDAAEEGADIVMTGGGAGPNSTAYNFHLDNVNH